MKALLKIISGDITVLDPITDEPILIILFELYSFLEL